MDINAYILSGILQDYALGQVSDQERREVECLSKIYPEISEALNLAEIDLERYASAYAVELPSSLKSSLMSAVKAQSQDQVLSAVRSEKSEPLNLTNQEVGVKNSFWGGLAAAAAVIAICFATWQYSRYQSAEAEIQSFSTQKDKLENEAAELENKVAELSDGINAVYNPFVRKLTLDAVKENESTKLALLWNTKTGEVKLNNSNLPLLAEDKQYQLWVLKDGKPFDMGVLSKTKIGILTAPNIVMEGDAFAITIEPLGGQPTPNLDQLVVMGATS